MGRRHGRIHSKSNKGPKRLVDGAPTHPGLPAPALASLRAEILKLWFCAGSPQLSSTKYCFSHLLNDFSSDLAAQGRPLMKILYLFPG